MTSRFATPPGQIPLEKGKSGYHLPESVAKSWKTLEQTLRTICTVLDTIFRQDRPEVNLVINFPSKPSEFGYFIAHPTEETARTALSQSLDAFVILFACVSFYIAISRIEQDPLSIPSSTSELKPRWFRHLANRKNRIHPEWLQLLADSPVADFTTGPQRLGGIINVSRCSWLHLAHYMIKANVPLWFYWGIPPTLGQPLVKEALMYAPRSHPQRPVATSSQPAAGPSQPVVARVPSRHAGPGQLPGETWKEFMLRQNRRRKAKLENESEAHRKTRESREMTAVKRQCPGKKGPTVYIWEEDNDVWTRTLLSRAEVEGYWGQYRSSQKIYNSIDNCWDLCTKFDEGTAGEDEDYDSNDDDDDIIPDRQKPTLHSVPTPAQVASDCLSAMDVDPTPCSVSTPAQVAPNPPQMEVDPTPYSIPTTDQVASDLRVPLTIVDPSPPPVSSPAADEEDDTEDIYETSKLDVLNAYSFVVLDLETMPTTTLDELVYYRYGFSLNENPYTGIPRSLKSECHSFRSWTEVCRAVGGQQLEHSALNRDAIEDFLSLLAGCKNPFKDVPGKYWDLSPLGQKPIVGRSKVFILVKEIQLRVTDGIKYSISPDPRFLDRSRDTSWIVVVDAMTALECIRRGLGPHTIDIANFLITHGVHFHTLERIQDSPDSEKPPVRPQCRYLGYRSLNYVFDLADFAGYEALRDSFLRSQPHGPLALRRGGIIARLAREVLPNSNALSGPTSEALGGQRRRFVCDDDSETYVDDEFLDDELRLICGTYMLGDPHDKKGMRIFPLAQLSCYY